MEEYFQEAGRAGRDGLPSKAHVFFNSYYISKARKKLSTVMREYVKDDKCKREMIMGYFGFAPPPPREEVHECSDYHAKLCKCGLLAFWHGFIDGPSIRGDASTDMCYVNFDLHHQYGISVVESQTFLHTKRLQRQRARKNVCFRRLITCIRQNVLTSWSTWYYYSQRFSIQFSIAFYF